MTVSNPAANTGEPLKLIGILNWNLPVGDKKIADILFGLNRPPTAYEVEADRDDIFKHFDEDACGVWFKITIGNVRDNTIGLEEKLSTVSRGAAAIETRHRQNRRDLETEIGEIAFD